MCAKAMAGPYARVYDAWLQEWVAAGIGSTQVFVMLKLCERLEFDRHGIAYSWYPRAEMAEELGLTDNALRHAVKRLVERGFLAVSESGHSGSATVYKVMPHVRWPRMKNQKHNQQPPENRGAVDGPPNTSLGGRDATFRGAVDGPPLRGNPLSGVTPKKGQGSGLPPGPRPEVLVVSHNLQQSTAEDGLDPYTGRPIGEDGRPIL